MRVFPFVPTQCLPSCCSTGTGHVDATFCLCLIRQRQKISLCCFSHHTYAQNHTQTHLTKSKAGLESHCRWEGKFICMWLFGWLYVDLGRAQSCVNTLSRDIEYMGLWPRQIAAKKIRKGKKNVASWRVLLKCVWKQWVHPVTVWAEIKRLEWGKFFHCSEVLTYHYCTHNNFWK